MDYTLGIYRRRRAGETWGLLHDKHEFEAADDDQARQKADALLTDVDWDKHFAALSREGSSFLSFWTHRPHA